MKKVLMILLTLAMVFSMASIVSAEEVPVTYKVEEDYEASIPTDGVALVAATGFADENVEAKTVGAKYAQIGDDRVLIITMKSANNFNVTYKDSNVQYVAGLLADESTGAYSEFANGAEVLRIPAGTTEGSTQMKFYTTEAWIKKATRSAEHSDSLTFTFTFEGMNNHPAVSQENFQAAVEGAALGGDVTLVEDVKSDAPTSSDYGKAGIVVKGGTLDGNGQTLTVTNAWSTWDCAVNPTSGTIKNLVIDSAMRGIFMGGATDDVYVENVVIDGPVYTFNSDGGNEEYGVYFSDSTLNGWTSFSNVHKEVIFTNCNFGEGAGYAFCRPYNACEFIDCTFEEGFEFDTGATRSITFTNCKYGDVEITVENAATLGTEDTKFFGNFVKNSAYSTILDGITINEVVAKDSPSSD